MKKGHLLLTVALGVLGVAAYHYFTGEHHTIRLSEAMLRAELERRLPFTRTYLVFFEVTLDSPRVALKDGADRADVGLNVDLNIRTPRGPLPLRGAVDASGGIRYVDDGGELYLVDPRVERVDITGIPERYEQKVNNALTRALSEYFRSRPIYTLQPRDAKRAVARLLLRDVVIQDRELVLTFGLK